MGRIVHLLITFFLVAIQTVTDRIKIFCPKTGEISAENRKICAKTVAGHVSSEEVPLPDASPGRRQSPVGGLWGTPFRSGVHWLWEVPPVHELVHLGTYLLDGGLHLLAVDVDGYPAGAALCHKR